MRLHIVSDLHMDREPWLAPVPRADVTLVAGDLFDDPERSIAWCVAHAERSGIPCLFVPGNHEFRDGIYQDRLRAMHKATRGTAVRLLHNRAVELGGVRFVGSTLWTDFELAGPSTREEAMEAARAGIPDFRRMKFRDSGEIRLFAPEDSLRLHRRGRRALQSALAHSDHQKVVVLSHHSPISESVLTSETPTRLHGSLTSNLNDYIAESGAALWVWGHIHDGFIGASGPTRLVCNSRGSSRFPNDQFVPDLVVSV